MTTETPIMQRFELAPDYEISRVIRGGWQMASGHGAVRSDDPVADMVAFAEAGITTFDCADIYTGVEELIGRFRLRYRDLRGQEALDRIRVHTKFVPDLEMLSRITKSYVESVIDQSLRRLNLESLDLVQFHWWDYDQPGGGKQPAGWPNCARPEKSARSAAPILTLTICWTSSRAACRLHPCRSNILCSTLAQQSA